MIAVSALVSLVVAGCWRLPRLAALAFGLSVAVTALYRGPGDNAVAAWLLLETVGQLCLLARTARRAAVLVPFGVAAVAVSPLRVGLYLAPPAPASEVVGVCAVFALLAAAATAFGVYLRSMDRARARAIDTARREQRLDLARDLHDWLAHEMTGIVLAAQAGQLDDADPARTFRQIEEAGLRGLAAMDRALRLLRTAADRSTPVSTLAEVRAVVDRFAESSTAEVTCAIGGAEPPAQVTATVHRVVVESLTNVRRHAKGATEVAVVVDRDGADVVVEVTDNGSPRTTNARRSGTGLAGLREWVSALDGTLAAGPAGPGWRVRAVLPT